MNENHLMLFFVCQFAFLICQTNKAPQISVRQFSMKKILSFFLSYVQNSKFLYLTNPEGDY